MNALNILSIVSLDMMILLNSNITLNWLLILLQTVDLWSVSVKVKSIIYSHSENI